MTLQQFYVWLADYKLVLLLAMLFAPWLALGICIVVPGKREEPFVLSFNLLMATVSLLLTVGYVWYATHTAGIDRIVQEADLLLILAPCYYVGVSLWITQQRIPLAQIPLVRAIQGLALIGAGYMGVVWLLSKLRIVLFSFLPFPFLVLLLLGLLAVAYMGYQRLTGDDLKGPTAGRRPANPSPNKPNTSIDDELEALRRDLEQ